MVTAKKSKPSSPSATTLAPAPTQFVAGPIHDRIGPIMDTAWLKLVDRRTLGEIITVQLDAELERIDVEKRAIERTKSIVAKAKG